MENPFLAMLWSAFGQALPYLVFLAVFVIALKWLEAKFAPKKRGRWRRSSRWDKSRGGGGFDRLSLQKIVYFLQALGVPFNVAFDQRLFGPFSSELKKAFFALERQGFLEGFSSEDRSARIPPGAYASADEFLKSSGEDADAQAAIERLYPSSRDTKVPLASSCFPQCINSHPTDRSLPKTWRT